MEIVIRAVVIFFALWVITRLVGRSTLGELSSFQLIVFVTMGDLVAPAVVRGDESVTGAALAVGTFALLTILFTWVNSRWRIWRPIVHGVPVVVLAEGKPFLRAMSRERLSMDDLAAAARVKGIADLAEVRLAVLETNGQLSFFTRDPAGADDDA